MINVDEKRLSVIKKVIIEFFGKGEYDEAVLEFRKKGEEPPFPFLKYTQEEKINRCADLEECIYMIPKGEWLNFLNYLYKGGFLSEQESADVLYSIWTSVEQIHNNGMSTSLLLKLMKKANKDDGTTEIINSLSDSDTVQIYRGTRANDFKALSWTIDKEQAEWFAQRFKMLNQPGFVYSGVIEKKYIFAYFEREDETVCDYRKIQNLQCEQIC